MKICILDLSLPRSHTTNFPELFITATLITGKYYWKTCHLNCTQSNTNTNRASEIKENNLLHQNEVNLAWIPELPLLLAWDAKLIAEGAILLKYLKYQINFSNACNIDQRNDSQQETSLPSICQEKISYLNPVVVCIRNNDLLLKAKAEAMGGVELAFAGT